MENDQSRTCPVCHQNDAVQKISAIVSTPEEPSSTKFSPFITFLSYALGIFGVIWLIGFLIFGDHFSSNKLTKSSKFLSPPSDGVLRNFAPQEKHAFDRYAFGSRVQH